MSISENLQQIKEETKAFDYTLVAVSKTKPIPLLEEAYATGQRVFGENKVQELCSKYEELPKDIEWHMIGHLQSNKVKYIAPFVSLIHAVDSLKLLKEINKQGTKNGRVINCLLQVHIAEEESKFGLTETALFDLLNNEVVQEMDFVNIIGLMGMATNTDDTTQVQNEFKGLKQLFDKVANLETASHINMKQLSMGMSGDYQIALEQGSSMIRVGSSIFGARNYSK
ncbi:MAG: YggS family pyridoxal phosphate-dependent enzyme [Cytophagales bacterium]|nr:YggS family pyridoxal phosphate-dependent enzyme [Cytophagales bacterium]